MLDPGNEPVLAPGVRGIAMELDGRIFIPLIRAERPGSGDVGRFLSSLSPRCVITTIISAQLEAMLRRRGWRLVVDGPEDELDEVWVHPNAPTRD